MPNLAMAKWLLLKFCSHNFLPNFITMVIIITVLYQILYKFPWHWLWQVWIAVYCSVHHITWKLTTVIVLFIQQDDWVIQFIFTVYNLDLYFIQLISVTGLYSFLLNNIYLTVQFKFWQSSSSLGLVWHAWALALGLF